MLIPFILKEASCFLIYKLTLSFALDKAVNHGYLCCISILYCSAATLLKDLFYEGEYLMHKEYLSFLRGLVFIFNSELYVSLVQPCLVVVLTIMLPNLVYNSPRCTFRF